MALCIAEYTALDRLGGHFVHYIFNETICCGKVDAISLHHKIPIIASAVSQACEISLLTLLTPPCSYFYFFSLRSPRQTH